MGNYDDLQGHDPAAEEEADAAKPTKKEVPSAPTREEPESDRGKSK